MKIEDVSFNDLKMSKSKWLMIHLRNPTLCKLCIYIIKQYREKRKETFTAPQIRLFLTISLQYAKELLTKLASVGFLYEEEISSKNHIFYVAKNDGKAVLEHFEDIIVSAFENLKTREDETNMRIEELLGEKK